MGYPQISSIHIHSRFLDFPLQPIHFWGSKKMDPKHSNTSSKTGWWFGTKKYFPINIGLLIIPIDGPYFSEGWPNHQPENVSNAQDHGTLVSLDLSGNQLSGSLVLGPLPSLDSLSPGGTVVARLAQCARLGAKGRDWDLRYEFNRDLVDVS